VKVDTLIVGQGLAGSLLAWQLLDRGQRLLVVDRDETTSSSKVAAGLVTPLSGASFLPSDGLEARLNFARRFYWELEERLGIRCFHHLRIARLFRDAKEAQRWEEAAAQAPEKAGKYAEPLEVAPGLLRCEHGGIEMKEGGWLDLPAFLEATRQVLLERAAYAIAQVDPDEVAASPGGVRWKNIEAKALVFAEGHRAAGNRFFPWLRMHAAAGDILRLVIPELAGETRIVNKGGWLLPLGGGRFRAGSTYRHDFDSPATLAEGREAVLEKLRAITPCEAAVERHESGIRPIIRRSQIFLGSDPATPRVHLFNGLGSKGVLNGPRYAAALADHLVGDLPLPSEADLRRQLL